MAEDTDTTQKKLNILAPDSRGFVLWAIVTLTNVETANDKTELFDVPEGCRVVGLAARTDVIDSGTTLTVNIEADTLGGVTVLSSGAIDVTTLATYATLLAASTGVLLVPLANEKKVTIQVDVATTSSTGGDGVLFVALELVRVDYERS